MNFFTLKSTNNGKNHLRTHTHTEVPAGGQQIKIPLRIQIVLLPSSVLLPFTERNIVLLCQIYNQDATCAFLCSSKIMIKI